MKKTILSIVLIFTILVSFSQVEYSSFEPMDIPLELRQKQLEKGNLIKNFSFENGEKLDKDTLNKSFKLDSWEILDKDVVQWTDVKNKYYKDTDANKGSKAIKITNNWKSVDETKQRGNGVRSDFIEVLPGNYLFYFDIKLKRVSSSERRLGAKIFKTVDIRIEYYDKDKKKMNGGIYYPYYEKVIDNEFKGYGFSNFWYINNFDWAKVRGRSYNYPFSEGDMPDGCKYVKIFFGLKGFGTMWVDNVDLRYSKWNFTTIERLKPLFEKEYKKTDLLIPQPKLVQTKSTIQMDKRTPVMVVPEKMNKETVRALKLIKQKLTSAFKYKKIEVVTNNYTGNFDNKLIINMGNTKLFETYKKDIPPSAVGNAEQFYYIKKLQDKNAEIIFLNGENKIGNFYAATTFVQFFNSVNQTIEYADIVDFPDFVGRSILLGALNNKEMSVNKLEGINRMTNFKINKIYNAYGEIGEDWKNPTEDYKKSIDDIGKFCDETAVIDLAWMFHPYKQFEYEMSAKKMTDSLKYYWIHSDEKNLKELIELMDIGLRAGAKTVMLMADDFVPHAWGHSKMFSLWTPEDEKEFVNLTNAQAFIINKLYEYANANYKDVRFEFCPPWYLNEFIDKSYGKAEWYFRDLVKQIPEDVAIIWTGNTIRSLSYDMADIERYRELIGRYPMLWDNTLYARRLDGVYGGYPIYYPGKARMCNIMEPYDIYLPKDFHKYNDGGHIYQNGGADFEYQRIKYATVADYEWNCNDYDADFSLLKSLLYLFNKETSMKILEYNDDYFHLVSEISKAEKPTEYKDTEKHIKKAGELIKSLNSQLKTLTKTTSKYPQLVIDFQNFLDGYVKRYEKLLEGKKDKKSGNRQI